MAIEFRLLEILHKFKIPIRGTGSELAKKLGVSNQSAGKILKGETGSLSYKRLEQICDWLLEKVPPGSADHELLRKSLPGALIGFTGAWDKILRKKRLAMFLGERHPYLPGDGNSELEFHHHHQLISGADAHVATMIMQQLSIDGGLLKFGWDNIPLQYPEPGTDIDFDRFKADIDYAKAIRDNFATDNDAAILIVGSQRANLLCELNICDIYDCRAYFDRRHWFGKIPFYLKYRDSDIEHPESSFGGHGSPESVRKQDRIKQGIYYRLGVNWHSIECVRNQDAGLVVVSNHRKREVISVTLFGFSSRSTRVVGDLFLKDPYRFWPLTNSNVKNAADPFDYSAFVCDLKFKSESGSGIDDLIGDPETISL